MNENKEAPKLSLTEVMNEAQDSVLYHGDRPIAVIREKLLIVDKRLTHDSIKALAEKYEQRVEKVRRIKDLSQEVDDVYILIEAQGDEEGEQVDLMAGADEGDVMPTIPTSREVQRQPWQGARATKQGGSWHIVVNDSGDSICYSYATPIAAVIGGALTFPTREGSKAFGKAHSFSATSSQHFAKCRRVVQYTSERGVPMDEFVKLIEPIVSYGGFPVGKRGTHAIGGTGRLPRAREGRKGPRGEQLQEAIQIGPDGRPQFPNQKLPAVGAPKTGFLVSKTYQVVTPESSENGEPSEEGFEYENEFVADPQEIVRTARNEGITGSTGNGDWWTSETDADIDMQSGSSTTYGLHVKNADGSALAPEIADCFEDAIVSGVDCDFPGYERDENGDLVQEWQDPSERLPFPEKKGKKSTREASIGNSAQRAAAGHGSMGSDPKSFDSKPEQDLTQLPEILKVYVNNKEQQIRTSELVALVKTGCTSISDLQAELVPLTGGAVKITCPTVVYQIFRGDGKQWMEAAARQLIQGLVAGLKSEVKESFLHPGEFTVNTFRMDTSGSGHGMQPAEHGVPSRNIPQLVNYIVKQMPDGIEETELDFGTLKLRNNSTELVITKGEERNGVGDITDKDADQIVSLVHSRIDGKPAEGPDPFAYQKAPEMAMAEGKEVVQENTLSGAGMADKVIVVPHDGDASWTLMILKDFDFAMRLVDTVEEQKWFTTNREKMFETYAPLLAFVKESKPVYLYSLSEDEGEALNSKDDLVPLDEAMSAAGITGENIQTVVTKAKELAGIDTMPAATGGGLPEARVKKPTLPKTLYVSARQNLDLILDLQESVSDGSGAVDAVKRLGLKLVKTMKARDKAESLLMVEKLDLQIRGYMALRETTGVHNYLVMERFHIYQKRTHQLFDEEAREWIDFTNTRG